MKDLYSLFEKHKSSVSFEKIRIGIASPEKIRSWSHGEVKKPETINYRTFKPERDGLFCAKIFGPTKDWECTCGKYKRMKHRGVICDKCGVEVIQSKVRRERLGHIELACPVSHVWFFKALPSRIGHLLDLTLKDLEKILYFESYLVIDEGSTPLKKLSILNEEQYRQAKEEHGDNFTVGIGAESIKQVLSALDLDQLSVELREGSKTVKSKAMKAKMIKRLKVVEALRGSNNKPEWMVLDVIPVIPPELRPLVPLEGGRFATSDLNDLYRRVINRNNRLRRLLELKAPEVIIRNEKRMLQEAVDALFDNGRRGRIIRGPNKRPLKSLSDMLKGKQGRFRQNLLGKRVDYSGRSVIVVGPELKLNQCGIPKKMALELFKPFIFNKLEVNGYVTTIKSAKKMVEKLKDEVWDALDEVIQEHPVLLNRAPTLHRLGIQAFDPILVEGKAIKLHPLVCAAFNADFDGDQMAVHVPLSVEAQTEARVLMLSINNILSSSNGRPITVPSQDMVLGCYYMTKEVPGAKGEGMRFSNIDEMRMALDAKVASIHAKIFLRIDGKTIETTVGRALIGEILPSGIPYSAINQLLKKKTIGSIIDECYRSTGPSNTVVFLDHLKNLGFEYATRAGVSVCVDDMIIPEKKPKILEKAMKDVDEVSRQYGDGLITDGERYNKVIDIWAHVTDAVSAEMMTDLVSSEKAGDKEKQLFNPIFMMADSGARGSAQQIRQLAGMRGLMAKPSGEIIETPITSNFREGLTVLQYFISTHGARKGLADTALKTANSGYLTRRLVDVAQDSIILEEDCGTVDGIEVTALVEGGEIIEPLYDRILGRVSAEDVMDSDGKKVIVKTGDKIDEKMAAKIVDSGVYTMKIRSGLTCETFRGVCGNCYGRDLGRGTHVDIGEAVGVIAAQSIGEPGTQLTMRTFHIGGTASQVAEQTTLDAKTNGVVSYEKIKTVVNKEGKIVVMNRNGQLLVMDSKGREKERYSVVYGATLRVKDKEKVKAGNTLVEWDPYTTSILTEVGGKIAFGDIIEGVSMREELDEVTGLSRRVIIDYSHTDLRPRLTIKGPGGKTLKLKGVRGEARYILPAGANILVEKGDEVSPGDVLVKIPRETTKTKDITGGLPRVAELFEARKPKEQAVISEVDGVVKDGGFVRGARRIIVVTENNEEHEYNIPRGRHVNVHEGDFVKAGEPLMDGSANPHDILSILGPKELQKYLVDEIQKVYRLQGVSIHDKHIEIIVRQMLKKVVIEDSGDTSLLVGEQVDKFLFSQKNAEAIKAKKMPAKGQPLLLGITKASLNTDSFISAASFQETTRALTEAAISGKVDELVGLKENVIMGRLIPAGTGIRHYLETMVKVDQPEEPEEEEEINEVKPKDLEEVAQ